MVEQWRPIVGWEGLYEVSNFGEVRSLTRYVLHRRFGPNHKSRYSGRVLRPTWSTGYARVNLVNTGHGRREQHYVHDLVLLMFVGPKPATLEVCHGKLGASVNALTNIRYDTRKENAADRKKGWKS